MNLGLLSLIFLFAAIIIGFVKKMNVGVLAVGLALIIGRIAGISDKDIIKGFDSSLFITLVGVTFLFSIINENKTLVVVAKKLVTLVGKKTWLVPAVIYIIGFSITAIGPGSIPTLAIMPAFAVPLALEMGFNPVMLAMIGDAGAFGGRMTAITPEGVLISGLLEKQNITNIIRPLFINIFITSIVLAVTMYIYYKGYKVKASKELSESSIPKFNREQIISLIGVIIMVIMVVAFKFNVGLVSFLIGSILIMLGAAGEGKCIKNIPWSVLLMVNGVGVLMAIVVKLDGITMLSNGLASLMNKYTAGAIMGITSGVMSWFSSGLGVVFPTLMPTVGNIVQVVGHGVKASELVSAIGIGGTITGLSPVSTTGALILATIIADQGGDKVKENKLFIELFAWSVVALVIVAVLGIIGLYRIF